MKSTGVSFALAVLVGAAIASSSVQCVADEISTDYLPLPDENDRYRNALWDEVLSKDSRPAGLAPEKMLEDFKERSRAAPSARECAFAEQMHQMGVRGLDACNTLTHRYIYEIFSLAKQHPDSPTLANHINFIKTIGKVKFAKCAATVRLLFELRSSLTRYGEYSRLDFLEYEDAMDMTFAAYANSKQERFDDEQHSYEVAKRANLVQGDFNIRRMLKIASALMSKKFMAEKPSKSEILQRFWENACNILRHSPFEAEFGNYNIAATLGAQLPENIPARFLKINEYRRICMTFDDAAGKNLQRQVEAISKWYKIG